MKAMVLAAGLGTRLRPLTNDRPKALVELQGRTMLELVLCRLAEAGVSEVMINVHYFAELIADYLAAHRNFGLDISLSREPGLLDTGGGLKNAASFFAGSDEPFLLHNVDILSTFNLAAMLEHHRQHSALATLAVQDRDNTRPLLFNIQGQLCGYAAPGRPDVRIPTRACVPQTLQPLAFTGIHVLSPRIFGKFSEAGAFPIIPAYLRLAAQGESILAWQQNDAHWRDLGTPASLLEAAAEPWVQAAFMNTAR
jgi:NDP-sugar pyrophosphorylase family protein